MSREKNIQLLKKISIIKPYLLLFELSNENILKVYNQLFENEIFNLEKTILTIKGKIEESKLTEAMNLLNNLKENVSKELFKNPCDKKWSELIITNDEYTKFCTECSKNVFLVENTNDFIKRKNLGQCVAFRPCDFNNEHLENKLQHSCSIELDDYDDEWELGLPY